MFILNVLLALLKHCFNHQPLFSEANKSLRNIEICFSDSAKFCTLLFLLENRNFEEITQKNVEEGFTLKKVESIKLFFPLAFTSLILNCTHY